MAITEELNQHTIYLHENIHTYIMCGRFVFLHYIVYIIMGLVLVFLPQGGEFELDIFYSRKNVTFFVTIPDISYVC